MISYLTPEQASALQAGGNAPMQIVDPTTRRVYYVIAGSSVGVIRWGQTLFSVFDVTGRIVLALFRVHDARPEYLG